MTACDLDLNRFRAVLKAKQADSEKTLRSRDAIAVERSADELEDTERAVEREITIQNLNRESKLLREIRGALRRIADGAFGTCLHCDEEIGHRRLEAVPWTSFCLKCQEAADRGDEDVIEARDVWMADAA